MLIDRAVVEVRSGKGGDGSISFLQEKNMPKGGPDGGNGGNGGSVYFVARKTVNTLFAFRHGKLIAASDGGKGDKKLRHGENGDDVTVEVPCGTVLYLEDGLRFLADLSHEGDTYCVAKGGRGGKGNACFKSSRLRIPKIAENGHPGERKRIVMELKMLADAGLVGFPSVGKSTLLNIVSHANVAVADYPFTTLAPNLGVVTLPDGDSQFILADLPGLIEGASEGKGLGMTFLRHIERCRVLIHLVSMENGEDTPYERYLAIRKELTAYGARLEERPELVVASKMDEEGAEERKKEFDRLLGEESFGISAFTNEGIEPLMKKAYELIQKTPEFPIYVEEGALGGMKVYDAHLESESAPFHVLHPSLHRFEIVGEEILRKAALINVSTDQGLARLLSLLRSYGIEEALEAKNIQEGDEVKIGDFVFEYVK